MSPRHNRRRADSPPDAPAARGVDRVEAGPDGEWHVRHVTGSASPKRYRCPGCDQEIAGTVPHVVAWPSDRLGGADDRRHWHTPCWSSRQNRSANVQRGRSAPRYG